MSKRMYLYGHKINVSEDLELYNFIRLQYQRYAEDAVHQFEARYLSYGGMEGFAEHGEEDGEELISSYVDHAVKVLVERFSVHHIDERVFASKYYVKDYYTWSEAVEKIRDAFMAIKLNAEQLNEYRRMRRESRGRWVGGGFGLEGAVKGAVTAGALNILSGVAHGAFNVAGSIFSAIGNSIKISNLYKSNDTRSKLRNSMYSSVFGIHKALFDVLRDSGYADDTDIPYLNPERCTMAKALANNFSRMEDAKVLENIENAFALNPYEEIIYHNLLNRFGDSDNELGDVARYFGTGGYLDTLKTDMLQTHFQKLSVDTEEKALEAKNSFEGFYENLGECDAGEQILAELNSIITRFDLEARTVDEFVFDSREEAREAQGDLEAIKAIKERYRWKEEEQQALLALEAVESAPLKSRLRDKYIEKIREELERFDKEARTIEDICFQTRNEAAFAKDFFSTAKSLLIVGKEDRTLDRLADKIVASGLIHSPQKKLFDQHLLSLLYDKLDLSVEEVALGSKSVFVDALRKIDALEAGKLYLDKIDSILKNFDEKARTAEGILFPSREEAAFAKGVFIEVGNLAKSSVNTQGDPVLDSLIGRIATSMLMHSTQKLSFDECFLKLLYQKMDVSIEEAAQNSHTILSQIIEKLEAVESGKCILLEIESVLKKFDKNARTLMCHDKSILWDSRATVPQATAMVETLEAEFQKTVESPKKTYKFIKRLANIDSEFKPIVDVYKNLALQNIGSQEKLATDNEMGWLAFLFSLVCVMGLLLGGAWYCWGRWGWIGKVVGGFLGLLGAFTPFTMISDYVKSRKFRAELQSSYTIGEIVVVGEERITLADAEGAQKAADEANMLEEQYRKAVDSPREAQILSNLLTQSLTPQIAYIYRKALEKLEGEYKDFIEKNTENLIAVVGMVFILSLLFLIGAIYSWPRWGWIGKALGGFLSILALAAPFTHIPDNLKARRFKRELRNIQRECR